MNKEIANRVKYLLLGNEKDEERLLHSWRALSEVICKEYPEEVLKDGWASVKDASGNQMHGMGLCAEASEELKESVHDWYEEQRKLLS